VVVAGKQIDCSDILADPVVRFQVAVNPWWNLAWCFVFPSFYASYFYGDYWLGFFTIGCLRWVISLHATWCVNSVAHLWGPRPYDPTIGPAESWFTAIVAVGEGWHNWHHFYPFDYATSEFGIFRQVNPSKLLIDLAALFGQVWDRKRATDLWERVKAKRQLQSNVNGSSAANNNNNNTATNNTLDNSIQKLQNVVPSKQLDNMLKGLNANLVDMLSN